MPGERNLNSDSHPGSADYGITLISGLRGTSSLELQIQIVNYMKVVCIIQP